MTKQNAPDDGNPTKKVAKSGKRPAAATRKYYKYERPRGGAARSISELMPEIGRAAFRRYGFIQSSVVSRWDEIVGSRYADVSLPESIRFPRGEKECGTLNLLVSGAHATMMQHIAPDIIERVNRFFGYNAVSQVRFRQGVIEKASDAGLSSTRRAVPPPSLKPVSIALGENLRDIGDPELNRVLESLSAAIASTDTAPDVGIKIIGRIGGGDKKKDDT